MLTLEGEWNLACGSLVEYLPTMPKAKALIPHTTKPVQTKQILGESSLMS